MSFKKGIDFRKKSQYIGNIYIWKEKDGYGVGINGSSHHYKVSKDNVYSKVFIDLCQLKNIEQNKN